MFRVSLEPTSMCHAKGIYEQVEKNRNALRDWLNWVGFVKSHKDTEKFIRDINALEKERKGIYRTICVDGNVSGMISIEDIDSTRRSGCLGYWLTPNLWGNGVVSHSTDLIEDECCSYENVRRVYARVNIGNARSIKVLTKANYQMEGYLRQSEFLRESYHDQFLFAKLFS